MLLLIFVLALIVFVALCIDGFDFRRIGYRVKTVWPDVPVWMPAITLVLLVLAILSTGKSPTP